ncbi:hypothetical protein [Candidatus Nitrosoglobus terrae]|nr:hypothetical protein [Candidatus Nitrosoglobus terrae]
MFELHQGYESLQTAILPRPSYPISAASQGIQYSPLRLELSLTYS